MILFLFLVKLFKNCYSFDDVLFFKTSVRFEVFDIFNSVFRHESARLSGR